jgi:all-trans-retinol dehydrogenase (NAD+)
MTDIAGKTILITGAASGLGKLMSQRFGQLGAKLLLWDCNKSALDDAVAELRTNGIKATGYLVDLSDKSAIARVAEQTLRDAMRIDVLVNNAGIVVGKPLLEASDEDIQRTFDVNTLALFWVTRAFLPGMIERNTGHIVTIASAAGISGTAKLVDYCSSKFAAVGFDDALRVELRRLNTQIKTTVVCPFYIDTGMFEGVKTRFPRLLPILKPDYVVHKIVKAVQSNKARLLMPRMIHVISPARLLPTAVFDGIQRFFGVSETMDDFVGRASPQQYPNTAAAGLDNSPITGSFEQPQAAEEASTSV